MKKKMTWVTIALLVWLVIRIIFSIIGLQSNFSLLNSGYSQIRDAGSVAVGGAAIVLILYIITIIGILMHYNQDAATPPIRWGPIAGFFAVIVDIVGSLAVVGIVVNFISSRYISSYASGYIAGAVVGAIFWNVVLAALLYVEYKREGETGQQTAAPPAYTFCQNCGTSISPGAKFCEHCGSRKAE